MVKLSKELESASERLYQRILEGELNRFPAMYWKRENSYESAAKITRYAMEQVLHWNPVEVMTKLYYPTFKELKLAGMFNFLFQSNREATISNVYPDVCWENKEFQLQCMRWLIGETGKLIPTDKDFACYNLKL